MKYFFHGRPFGILSVILRNEIQMVEPELFITQNQFEMGSHGWSSCFSRSDVFRNGWAAWQSLPWERNSLLLPTILRWALRSILTNSKASLLIFMLSHCFTFDWRCHECFCQLSVGGWFCIENSLHKVGQFSRVLLLPLLRMQWGFLSKNIGQWCKRIVCQRRCFCCCSRFLYCWGVTLPKNPKMIFEWP